MNEIASNLSSFTWWFSAVFVAIVVNLVSSYLRNATDTVWRYAQRKFRDREKGEVRSERIAESNVAFLEQLKTDESLRRFFVEAEVRARLMSLELFITGLACAGLGFFVVNHPQQFLPAIAGRGIGFFSLFVLWTSTQQFSLAHALSKALLEVERSGGLT